ncbi:MAG: hypothetical protein WB764_25780 [Xanthobacteraceae bacterium]
MNASRARLVAAFREGFGLAAIAVIDGPDGVRIAAAAPGAEIACGPAETVYCRWWCPRAFEAASIATAAAARLHNRETRDGAALWTCQAVVRAAKQRNIDLYSDEEILEQATAVIARIDDELEHLRQSGDLRPVNKSYQSYRCEAAAKGERVVPYAQWMLGYKEELVRKLAATLRYL